MAHYIDADRLRVEIESLEENARKIRVAKESTTNEKIGADGQVNLCQKLYLLINSLQQEQPVLPGIDEEGIPGRDFIPVWWVDACERYGKWKIVRVEQPDGLEKEIEECAKSDLCPDDCTFLEFACIARHFAEWGAKHLKSNLL